MVYVIPDTDYIFYIAMKGDPPKRAFVLVPMP